MHLIWLPKARADLRGILEYISERNTFAADRLNGTIERSAEMLASHPLVGRPGRVPATRELVAHPNYILVYRVDDDSITIVAVLHSRQNYP